MANHKPSALIKVGQDGKQTCLCVGEKPDVLDEFVTARAAGGEGVIYVLSSHGIDKKAKLVAKAKAGRPAKSKIKS